MNSLQGWMTWLRLGGTHRTRDQRSRSGHGFSTISMGFLMLTMMLPIVFIGEGVLVSARQATSNALGQENLRAKSGWTHQRLGRGVAQLGPMAPKTFIAPSSDRSNRSLTSGCCARLRASTQKREFSILMSSLAQ